MAEHWRQSAPPLGFDQQGRDPPGHGRFGDLRQVISAKPPEPCLAGRLDQWAAGPAAVDPAA